MKTTPEFTDAEIQEMMDFSQVLAMTEAAKLRNKKIVRGILTTVLIIGLVSGGLVLYNKFAATETSVQSSGTEQPSATNVPSAANPSTTTALPDTTRQSVIRDGKQEPTKKPTEKSLIAEKKKATTSAIQVDSTTSVFLPAEPANGYPALYEYFARDLRYPKEATKDSIQGVISVSFVINAQGIPEQVVTDHLLGEAFEKEAIRLIEHMPAWKPAQLDGSPVSSKLSVPITFTIKTARQR